VSSYHRHVSYCRRARSRGRKRGESCRNCRKLKAKCSFTSPCGRCSGKGIECVYDYRIPAGKTTSDAAHDQDSGAAPSTTDQELAVTHGWFDADDIPLETITDSLSSSLFRRGSHQDASDHIIEVGASVVSSDNSILGEKRYLTRLRSTESLSQQSCNLVMDALCAIPEQMLRKSTFPPFIHAHWGRESLPEPLAVCMRIAQMFASRSSNIEPFIWRTILAEQRRFVELVSTCPRLRDVQLSLTLQRYQVYRRKIFWLQCRLAWCISS
jgi:hypothetical protein